MSHFTLKTVKPLIKVMSITSLVMLAGCYGRFEPYQTTVVSVERKGFASISECQPYDTARLTASQYDCFVESARWQSMVHPERVAPHQNDTAEVVNPYWQPPQDKAK